MKIQRFLTIDTHLFSWVANVQTDPGWTVLRIYFLCRFCRNHKQHHLNRFPTSLGEWVHMTISKVGPVNLKNDRGILRGHGLNHLVIKKSHVSPLIGWCFWFKMWNSFHFKATYYGLHIAPVQPGWSSNVPSKKASPRKQWRWAFELLRQLGEATSVGRWLKSQGQPLFGCLQALEMNGVNR